MRFITRRGRAPATFRLTAGRKNAVAGWVEKLVAIVLVASVAFVVPRGIVNAQDASAPPSFRDCSDCPEMVVVPPGQFLMGSSDEDTKRDLAAIPKDTGLSAFFFSERSTAKGYLPHEHPQHQVAIASAFAMSRYPVTRSEFAAFVKETRHQTVPCWLRGHPGRQPPPQPSAWLNPGFAQTDRDPVVCVGWKDAQAYVRWLNQRMTHDGTSSSAGPYQLPSEAEWEYAARAGTQTARWWGDDVGTNYAVCDGCNFKPIHHTVPVGSFPANPFGLYDVLGNVAVLTADCWHDSYVGAPTDGSAWESGDCQYRTARGAGWLAPTWAVRSAERARSDVGGTTNDTGFRVVRAMPQS